MIHQDLNFNVYNIIILIGIFQGFVFAITVFFNKNYNTPTNYFLVFTALALSLSNLQYLILDIQLVNTLTFQIPFEFLIMPMFFIFVNNYLKIESKKNIVTLILIPFLISFLLRILVKLFPDVTSSEFIRILFTFEEYVSLIFSILLIAIILFKIYTYERSRSAFDIQEVKAKTKWLKQALVIGIIVCSCWVFVIRNTIARFDDNLSSYYPLWIIISLLVYWIVYKGVIETRILNQRTEIRDSILKKMPEKPKAPRVNDDLFLEIENSIVAEKLFLNPNLSLDVIADQFNISTSHLSKVVNKNADKSFTDFINTLRIEEAKHMLSSDDYQNYTIEAVGYESGFNSKSNFYSAFKKITGTTPSSFRSDR